MFKVPIFTEAVTSRVSRPKPNSLMRLWLVCQVLLLLSFSPFSQAVEFYAFVDKWGSIGSGEGQFNSPTGIAIDASGNVYVVDNSNNRIQKFDTEGNYQHQWGSQGSGNGQFYYPTGIAIDASDNVYVADNGNNRIQKFDTEGNYQHQWGSYGTGNGQFSSPWAVAVDAIGSVVYVTDINNIRIQQFDATGNYQMQWGSLGNGDGQFGNTQFVGPAGIAVDASGNVYAGDSGNHRIQKFGTNGLLLAKWGLLGTGDGRFYNPTGVRVDSNSNVYVVDTANHRIQKFDANGQLLTKWGSFGGGDGEFFNPYAVAVDASGSVYVADTSNHRIQKFAPTTMPSPPNPSQCATFNLFPTPALFLPCLSVGGTYQVGMNLVSNSPLRFEVDMSTWLPRNDLTPTAQCAVFPDGTASTPDHLRINCLQIGEQAHWVDLALTSVMPTIQFDVVGFGP